MPTTPELTWSVKDSLISYVESLDDGSVEAVEPATRANGGFHFVGQEAEFDRDRAAGALQFRGTVRLTGYWGALNIELRDPRVELDGKRGTLSVRERGGLDPNAFLPFADLELTAADAGSSGVLDASASLTGQGQLLMGGQYRVGQALSPIRITFASHDE